jgi:hypothetical protein
MEVVQRSRASLAQDGDAGGPEPSSLEPVGAVGDGRQRGSVDGRWAPSSRRRDQRPEAVAVLAQLVGEVVSVVEQLASLVVELAELIDQRLPLDEQAGPRRTTELRSHPLAQQVAVVARPPGSLRHVRPSRELSPEGSRCAASPSGSRYPRVSGFRAWRSTPDPGPPRPYRPPATATPPRPATPRRLSSDRQPRALCHRIDIDSVTKGRRWLCGVVWVGWRVRGVARRVALKWVTLRWVWGWGWWRGWRAGGR